MLGELVRGYDAFLSSQRCLFAIAHPELGLEKVRRLFVSFFRIQSTRHPLAALHAENDRPRKNAAKIALIALSNGQFAFWTVQPTLAHR